jgi:hypothetical protein
MLLCIFIKSGQPTHGCVMYLLTSYGTSTLYSPVESSSPVFKFNVSRKCTRGWWHTVSCHCQRNFLFAFLLVINCINNKNSFNMQQLSLTRRPGRLLPSDSAPGLQCGSGSSSDFRAKILGADTPPFLWKTQFYFSLSSLLLHILVKCRILISSATARGKTQRRRRHSGKGDWETVQSKAGPYHRPTRTHK